MTFPIYFIKLTHLPFSPLLYKYRGLEGFLHRVQEVHKEQIPSYHSKLRLLLELRKNMSIQVSGAPFQIAKSGVVRRTANYHPSIWGDRFLNNTSEDKVRRLFATLVYENYVVKFIIFLVFFVTIKLFFHAIHDVGYLFP